MPRPEPPPAEYPLINVTVKHNDDEQDEARSMLACYVDGAAEFVAQHKDLLLREQIGLLRDVLEGRSPREYQPVEFTRYDEDRDEYDETGGLYDETQRQVLFLVEHRDGLTGEQKRRLTEALDTLT